MIVIAVVIIGAAGAGIFLSSSGHKSSTTTTTSTLTTLSNSTSTQGPFKVTYATLIVGYQGGLFQLGLQDESGKLVVGIVAVLNINKTLQAVMCSGAGGSGLGFGSCLPASGKSYTYSAPTGGSFPANTTFTGYDSGAGPGGAVVGTSYPLIITATYTDGTSSTETVTVQATTG